MLLALLEQVEGFKDDLLYITVLPCLKDVLLRLPVKRGRSLELAMDTLGDHIAAIPAPQNWMLEGEETKLLETDETVRRFLEVIPAFLDFMQPFLEIGDKAAAGDISMSNRRWEVRVLKKHLVLLLRHPLVFLDLRYDATTGAPKTYSRECAEQVVKGLEHVERNFYRLVLEAREQPKTARKDKSGGAAESSRGDKERDEVEEMVAENVENELRASGEVPDVKDEEEEVGEVPELAAACLAYLVQAEGLGLQRWPCVHSHRHLLHAMLAFIRMLLTHVAHTAVYKGLALLSFRLSLLPDSSLPAASLDDPDFTAAVLDLIHVMTRCPIRELRQMGLSVFRSVFSKIDVSGRHQLMRSVLTSCEHAGVKAVLVGMVKDEVDAALRTCKDDVPDTKERQAECEFLGPKLEVLLRLATKLPDGAASDLLEESDVVMATLNLLRYLVLRDPRERDQTGVWVMMRWIEQEYLAALRTGLDMSVGHYRLELDNMMKNTQGHSQGGKGGSDVTASLSVAGRDLPPMSHDQQMTVMHSALTTFDMMKCVLSRLCELIDAKQKGTR
nr:hypothetical protein BaRGS_029762 [Batillaria attramentaria]